MKNDNGQRVGTGVTLAPLSGLLLVSAEWQEDWTHLEYALIGNG